MTIFDKFKLQGNCDSFTVAIACPHDYESLNTIKLAFERAIITDVILCGEEFLIRDLMKKYNFAFGDCRIIGTSSDKEAAEKVALLVSTKEADVPMKGLLDTSTFLKALLNRDLDIRDNLQLAHVMLIHRESDDLHYIVADGGMNILPTVDQKRDIIVSAVKMANALGKENPIVVPLTAKEKVYDKMPATVDADKLRQMNETGELTGCTVTGPLQFDLAISKESAEKKNFDNPLAGKAEVLIVPNIESGNIFVKALTYLADFIGYGLVLGAKVPMIVVSRSDGEEEKLGSIYLARLMFEKERNYA